MDRMCVSVVVVVAEVVVRVDNTFGCGSAWIAVSTGDISIYLSLSLYTTISTMSLSNMRILYIVCCRIVRSIFHIIVIYDILEYTRSSVCCVLVCSFFGSRPPITP